MGQIADISGRHVFESGGDGGPFNRITKQSGSFCHHLVGESFDDRQITGDIRDFDLGAYGVGSAPESAIRLFRHFGNGF